MTMTLDPRLLRLAESNAPLGSIEALLASEPTLTAPDRAALSLAVDSSPGVDASATFRGLNQQKRCEAASGAGPFRGLNAPD